MRSGDLVRKENNDSAVAPAIPPIGMSNSSYKPLGKLSDEISKMKEKFLKEKTG